jgi:hypothetical protein
LFSPQLYYSHSPLIYFVFFWQNFKNINYKEKIKMIPNDYFFYVHNQSDYYKDLQFKWGNPSDGFSPVPDTNTRVNVEFPNTLPMKTLSTNGSIFQKDIDLLIYPKDSNKPLAIIHCNQIGAFGIIDLSRDEQAWDPSIKVESWISNFEGNAWIDPVELKRGEKYKREMSDIYPKKFKFLVYPGSCPPK